MKSDGKRGARNAERGTAKDQPSIAAQIGAVKKQIQTLRESFDVGGGVVDDPEISDEIHYLQAAISTLRVKQRLAVKQNRRRAAGKWFMQQATKGTK